MQMFLMIAAITLILIIAGLPYKMDVDHRTFRSAKLSRHVRICVLADLHCRRFGEKQSKILRVVEEEKPDMILIPGDLFDYERDFEISFELIEGLKGIPVYFCSGNHDNYLDEMDELRNRLSAMGVHVLEHEAEMFSDEIEIIGLNDMGRAASITPEGIEEFTHSNGYRILMTHRPDYDGLYRKCRVDLIVCGHVHGGQWRIPFLHRGLLAPNRHILPKYWQGVYDLDGIPMLVSRGLASGSPKLPRLYNNPEINIIDLEPEEQI